MPSRHDIPSSGAIPLPTSLGSVEVVRPEHHGELLQPWKRRESQQVAAGLRLQRPSISVPIFLAVIDCSSRTTFRRGVRSMGHWRSSSTAARARSSKAPPPLGRPRRCCRLAAHQPAFICMVVASGHATSLCNGAFAFGFLQRGSTATHTAWFCSPHPGPLECAAIALAQHLLPEPFD